jgi:hypothetical protein
MLVVSRGNPTTRDWLMVLAVGGGAASIGMLVGSWRNRRRT